MANSSMLVLPTTTAPAARQPVDHGGVVGGAPALEDARRAGGGHPPGAEVVLQRDRHAGQRARVLARGHPARRRRRPAARAWSAVTRLKAWTCLLAGLDGGQVLLEHVDGRRLARAGPARPARRRAGRGHGASPEDAGHPEAVVLDRRAPGPSTSSRSRQGRTSSGRSTLVSGQGVGGRLHPGQVERGHVGGVVEHLGQLPGEQVELLLGQLEAGQGGHVGHVGAGEAVRARPSGGGGARGRPGPRRRTRPPAPRSGRRRSRGWPRGSCARGRPARPGRRPPPRGRRPTPGRRRGPRGCESRRIGQRIVAERGPRRRRPRRTARGAAASGVPG